MKAKIDEKKRARELRKEGISIKKIARIVGASSSSVCIWVRDIKLTKVQQKNLNGLNYGNRMKAIYAVRSRSETRWNDYEISGYNRAKIDHDFQLIAALYWGEGSKSRNVFKVANCDSDILRIVFNWLVQEGFDDKISFSVIYHAENGITEDELKLWWKKSIPGLQAKHFRKFYIKDTSKFKNRRVGKIPYGTGYVGVYSTELHLNIVGGIRYIRENLVKCVT